MDDFKDELMIVIEDSQLDNITNIHNDIDIAIEQNNIAIIEKIMLSDKYSNLTHQEKEQQVFTAIYISFNYYGTGEDLLKYIIFDYKINESVLTSGVALSNEVNGMFETRRLNEQLSAELNRNKDVKDKRVKV